MLPGCQLWDAEAVWGETELEDEVLIPEGTVERKEVCIRAILCECLQHDLAFKDRRLSNELAAIMVRIPGWEKEEKTKRVLLYGPQRIYRKKIVNRGVTKM